jgi:hypothetical protein
VEATEGLSSLKRAVSIAKALKEGSQGDSLAHANINDLLEALLEAKDAFIDARELLADYQADLKRLREHAVEREALIPGRDGYKYKANGEGQPDGYPACPHCEQIEGLVVLLVPDGHWRKGQCPACDKRFSPIYPYNSIGQREEAEERKLQSTAIRDAARRLNGP